MGGNGAETIAKNGWHSRVWKLLFFKTNCLKNPVNSQIRYAKRPASSISPVTAVNVKHGGKAIFAEGGGKNCTCVRQNSSGWQHICEEDAVMYDVTTAARFKRVLGVLLGASFLFLFSLTSLRASSVNQTWEPSTDSNVVGYNVYYGTASHSYQTLIPVGNHVSAAVSGLSDGTTYYFAVTAIDAFGVESDFSTEISSHTSGNGTPSISLIGDQTVNAGQATPAIAFSVTDSETSAGGVIVSGTSSDTTLVPNANIVLGGSGASRIVTVTPTPGLSGSVQITLTVSDGTNSASSGFSLTVQPPVFTDTAPTISGIGSQNVTSGQSTPAIPFTIGDAETSAGSLTLSASSSATSLVPNGNIVLG